MTNDEFCIPSSFVIRHSDFVISVSLSSDPSIQTPMLDLTIMATVQNGLNAVAGAHDALAAAKAAGLDAQSALLAAEDRKQKADAALAQAENKLRDAKRELAAAIETAFPSPEATDGESECKMQNENCKMQNGQEQATGTPPAATSPCATGSASAALPEVVAPVETPALPVVGSPAAVDLAMASAS